MDSSPGAILQWSFKVFEKYLCLQGPRRWGHPSYQFALVIQSLNKQATVYLEAEGTLSGRFICLRKMEMWRKCKDALKQLCCGKRRRGGGARRAQPLWDSRHVSSWLKSLLGGRAVWAQQWRDGLQSAFSQADACREICSLAEMSVFPAPGAIQRRSLSVQGQGCQDSGLLRSLGNPVEPWESCRALSRRACGRLLALRRGETWGLCLWAVSCLVTCPSQWSSGLV